MSFLSFGNLNGDAIVKALLSYGLYFSVNYSTHLHSLTFMALLLKDETNGFQAAFQLQDSRSFA